MIATELEGNCGRHAAKECFREGASPAFKLYTVLSQIRTSASVSFKGVIDRSSFAQRASKQLKLQVSTSIS